MMQGMTVEQFKEVVEFSTRNHGFYRFSENDSDGNACEIPKDKKLNHKYIECRYDSRDAQVWIIIFYGGFSPEVAFACNHFRLESEENKFEYSTLYEWVMGYLKREWT